MDESVGTQEDDSTDVSKQSGPTFVDIVSDGDVVLDVTFNTSKETLRLARKAAAQKVAARKSGNGRARVLKPQVRVAYRVRLATLKEQSGYFRHMLSDSRFVEGRTISEAFAKLTLRGVKADDAEPADLPWVKIVDDDEATRSAHRDVAFGDLLRMLHEVDTVAKGQNMHSVAVLTVLADRFDCLPPVSRYIFGRIQFKWTPDRKFGRDGERATTAQEETVRQKILVSWLLDRPPNFHAATRELIMTGSTRWSAYEEPETTVKGATWWDLQDDIESK